MLERAREEGARVGGLSPAATNGRFTSGDPHGQRQGAQPAKQR